MAYVRCPNCGFTAAVGWDAEGIGTCPECCTRMRLDGGLEQPQPGPLSVRQRLAVTKWAPTEARRALAPLLGEVGELAPMMELTVSELVTNSVRHAVRQLKGVITVEVEDLGDRWRVAVEDDGPGFSPVSRGADQDPGSGWGLFLIDRISDVWGVEREGDRTRVWCELSASDPVELPERPPSGERALA